MPDIKIFVSHRIDINSELIENPLYIPVRCGAVFDKENPMDIAGDDTGDNISEKRMSFCEFTVQYWAWKNVQADYYGLCHYRRYLSFANQTYMTDYYDGMVHRALLVPKEKNRFGLLDSSKMETQIEKYDLLVAERIPVRRLVTPVGVPKTVQEMWLGYHGQFLDKEYIQVLFETIRQMAPEYFDSAKEYLRGSVFWGYNCYVMKKELFSALCEFEYPILFSLESKVNLEKYPRVLGYLGEILYGIFVFHVYRQNKWRIKEQQLLYICDSKRIDNRRNSFWRYIKCEVKRCITSTVNVVFPKGSRIRSMIKSKLLVRN